MLVIIFLMIIGTSYDLFLRNKNEQGKGTGMEFRNKEDRNDVENNNGNNSDKKTGFDFKNKTNVYEVTKKERQEGEKKAEEKSDAEEKEVPKGRKTRKTHRKRANNHRSGSSLLFCPFQVFSRKSCCRFLFRPTPPKFSTVRKAPKILWRPCTASGSSAWHGLFWFIPIFNYLLLVVSKIIEKGNEIIVAFLNCF